MDAAVAEHGLEVAGKGAHGGSSLWMRAPENVDTGKLADRLRADSVLIEPGAPFFFGPEGPRNYYRLAYSSINRARIPEGVEIIGRTLADA